jgi:putative ABC transport system permease protein
MSEYVDRAMAPTRFALVLIVLFGAVAVALASVGLYGVLTTTVSQRSTEIGLRMALGATTDSIFRLIVGQGLRLSAVGILIGVCLALALTRVLDGAGMLVSVKSTDPTTYFGIIVLFALIAASACWIPAWRAANLPPHAALHGDLRL